MKPAADFEQTIECLKQISLFKEMTQDRSALEQIAKLFATVFFNKGELVIEERQSGDSMYIIKSGTVEVIKKTKQGEPYVVVDLTADKHSFFGELALLDPDERSATVRCKTDCEFYTLQRDEFIKYGNENPLYGLLITREISKILCKRLRRSNVDIITLFDALVEEVEKSGGIQ